ncbi:spore germination lipoprotein GerD [Domibacillus epiphyticus]|uniref:Spore gernimation protein GerD n=1 Tax=Domibacillus epiphyticus TaxID=1714355 RepID=A0A1V2A575_9BACI|nr:spore germination lipoprotein GerD [Domibacillus epiphyticus]OMP66126.1 spore gernimation protein GerD [Domibacillus epiphyticus]
MKSYSLLMMMLFSFVSILIAGCAANGESAGQADYEETKKMVIDILKTDDGKKALQELMKDKEIQQALVMDQQAVTKTIQTTLTSDKGQEFWKKAFEDPKFAESFAKSMQTEHEKLMKGLMTDPDYQKMLLGVFQDPEMQKTIQTSMKSQEFRKHLQDVVMETLSNPLYKAKLQETLLKAAEEAGKQGGGS